jgi:hypothetical protein
MGNQTGIFKFRGKLDGYVGYDLNGVNVIRKIGRVDPEKRKTAPQYAETRKNQLELAVASKVGKLFRQAISHITRGYTAHDYPAAMVSLMLRALRADDQNEKGHKKINIGLRNYEVQSAFRKHIIFASSSCRHYHQSLIQRGSAPGAWQIFPSILWLSNKFEGTKHINLAYVHFDFENHVAEYASLETVLCTPSNKDKMIRCLVPKPISIDAAWSFLIAHVWHYRDDNSPAILEYVAIIDIIENQDKK